MIIFSYSIYPESQKTIVRWIREIISYFNERITNGVVEGINNKFKLIKRSTYGFRNFNDFRPIVIFMEQIILDIEFDWRNTSWLFIFTQSIQ